MYNLTILLRKANATTECENDVRELRFWDGFAKLCVPLEKSWLRPCSNHFIYLFSQGNLFFDKFVPTFAPIYLINK